MIVADITMSLDGYVTGPEPGPGQGLGRGGKPMHAWAFDPSSEVDAQVLREAVDSTGAVVMGRRTFEVVDAPGGWSEDVGYGAGHATTPPVLIDELRIHLAPIILGAGTRLFSDGQTRQLVQHSVEVSPLATHLTYRLAPA
jgi:dihydrofolate reductase